MKTIQEKLSTICVLVKDKDILIYTLNGLPQEYNAFRTSLRLHSTHVRVEELHVLLKAEEVAISVKANGVESIFQPTAMTANYRP